MTTQTQTLNLEEQIAQLQSEVTAQELDVRNLQEAIVTLKTGKPRPTDPAADDIFNLLKEAIGAVPENLQQQRLYQEKWAAAQRSLQLAIEACQEKQRKLDALLNQKRSQIAEQLFQELSTKADKFNAAIDQVVNLHSEIKALNQKIAEVGAGKGLSLSTYADMNELPWIQIAGQSILIRRRFDAIRDS